MEKTKRKKGEVKMLTKKECEQRDVVTVDFGIGAERETIAAVRRRTTDTPRSGQTTSGYGSKLPTCYMLYVGNRWRRVYATCYSNAATCYIIQKGEKIVVSW